MSDWEEYKPTGTYNSEELDSVVIYNLHTKQSETFKLEELDLVEEFNRLIKEVSNPKNGDHVVYNGKHKARVISTLPDGKVRIKFNDSSLIPTRMNVPVEYLEYQLENGVKKRFINPEVACPNCDKPWKKTEGFNKFYYDCPDCGLHKEDVIG